jgi:hypothetical protein
MLLPHLTSQRFLDSGVDRGVALGGQTCGRNDAAHTVEVRDDTLQFLIKVSVQEIAVTIM